MSRLWHEFNKGILRENPVFRVLLGLCPTLAVSNSIANAIGMGVATTFVLLGSNTVVSSIRKVVPAKVRIPSYIVVIASFVTIAELSMAAFVPALHQSLGIFVPLIVVNCIILGRAEGFASRRGVGESVVDALGMGAGFTLALLALAFFRELLGAGKLYGITILGEGFKPVILMILPPGGFLTLGFLLGLFNRLSRGNGAATSSGCHSVEG
jgi:electron transport complex protein RnfE